MKTLKLYQFTTFDLLRFTDGRLPESRDEDRAGSRLIGTVPPDMALISLYSAKSAEKVLGEIGIRGVCQLHRFEGNDDWRKAWTDQGRASQ